MPTMQSIEHLIGRKFRQLTITKDLGVVNNKRMCLVTCECGTVKEMRVSELVGGKTKSCGCRLQEAGLERIRKGWDIKTAFETPSGLGRGVPHKKILKIV